MHVTKNFWYNINQSPQKLKENLELASDNKALLKFSK